MFSWSDLNIASKPSPYQPVRIDDHEIEDEPKTDLSVRKQRRMSWTLVLQWTFVTTLILYSFVITTAYTKQQQRTTYASGFATEFSTFDYGQTLKTRQSFVKVD